MVSRWGVRIAFKVEAGRGDDVCGNSWTGPAQSGSSKNVPKFCLNVGKMKGRNDEKRKFTRFASCVIQ